MPDARHDPLTGRWVILAPGRAQRPDTVAAVGSAGGPAGASPEPTRPPCPFCPGNEHLTPPEIARTGTGEPGEPGWRTRVFPNRYPILAGAAGPTEAGGDPLREDRPATGAHEVIVLSPDHQRSLADLDADQVVEVLTVMRDRTRRHLDDGHAFSLPIVNHGAEGGASLAHPHAQVVAGDVEAPLLADEMARLATGGRCLVCAELARHDDDPALVVARVDDADSWCPWWSGTAFEMLLAPRRHRADFGAADDELAAVGHLLRDGLGRLGRAAGDPAYNLVVHSRPGGLTVDFHWHVHIWPRLQRDGGVERGAGLAVAVVDPADAAARLREA